MASEFFSPISRDIWRRKYQLRRNDGSIESNLDEMFWRVARAVASAEGDEGKRSEWASKFRDIMVDWEFIPAGRILSGAGADRNVTLFNCFVLGTIEDDLSAIFDAVKKAALTMQSGGGIGHDFSTLRPRGSLVRGVGAAASGPVSFMDVWNAMCATLMSAGQRRGAMMATLRCDHPDIEEFIDAKSDPARLRNFNLSVLVTDDFMKAVKTDGSWNLTFEGCISRSISARELWEKIARSNYQYAEPGVIFIDRVNAANNLNYCETISATNPCGEQPLPPYGACLLGSLNLTRFIKNPFTPLAKLDQVRLREVTQSAIRFLDNVIDVSRYPLLEQEHEARSKRRVGLGLTGLADALIMLGIRYGSEIATQSASNWMKTIQETAYLTSAGLAEEKGAFPLYDRDAFAKSVNLQSLGKHVQATVGAKGLRNGCLTSIAPTGTISLLAGNVSSGVEPVFEYRYARRIKDSPDVDRDEIVEDYAYSLFQKKAPGTEPEGHHWVTASSLSPMDHLAMQAALQPYVDSAISKTINCPADIDPQSFQALYMDAYDRSLKGCTLFRPNEVTGSILSALPTQAQGSTAPARAKTSEERRDGVVYMSEPLERDAVLTGKTYKLKWPASDHAYYITINDLTREGRRRPFEIFINTKDLTHYAWTVALTRMISAVFRRGGDVSFVAQELKAIFDPQGGQWMAGSYVPSLLVAIGQIIETHIQAESTELGSTRIAAVNSAAAGVSSPPTISSMRQHGETHSVSTMHTSQAVYENRERISNLCPRCSQPNFRLEGSCRICLSCGHSSCG